MVSNMPSAFSVSDHAGRIEAGHSIGADGPPVLANAAIDVLGALGELDLRPNRGLSSKTVNAARAPSWRCVGAAGARMRRVPGR